MAVIPTLKELKKGMRARNPKENAIYKIVFDVLHHYLKETDGPDF